MNVSMAFDPFAGRNAGKAAQTIREIKTEDDHLVERVVNLYKNLELDMHDTRLPLLNPLQINLVLSKCIALGLEEHAEASDLAALISRLIQKSYDAGNTNFVLDTYDTQIPDVGHFKARSKRRMSITVHGNVGTSFGYQSKYVDVSISGSAANGFGQESYKSSYQAKRTELFCGSQSDSCMYSVLKGFGEYFAHATTNSEFTFHSKMTGRDMLWMPKSEIHNCTFRCVGGKTYDELEFWLNAWNGMTRYGNKLELIK